MLVAVFIIIFAAAFGYITYLLHFSGQSRMEMGFLQALGLRGRQMTWLLSAEHLVIATIGLVIGTLAGFSMRQHNGFSGGRHRGGRSGYSALHIDDGLGIHGADLCRSHYDIRGCAAVAGKVCGASEAARNDTPGG